MADETPEKRLTLKQELFVAHYLGDCKGNGTAAARAAGYGGKEENLRRTASANLTNPHIRARMDGYLVQSALPAMEVLQRLSAIARSDWSDLVEIHCNRRGEVMSARIALSDVLRALELLGKHYGLFTERVETTQTVKKVVGVEMNEV